MKNLNSASFLAAASLSMLSIGAALPTLAQTAAPATATASDASPASVNSSKASVAQFSAMYHVPVIQDTTPMVALPLGSEPTARLDALQQLAADNRMTWRKVYQVSPATADSPSTSLTSAEQMVDQPAQINLSASGIPESSAFKTAAAADNATVEYTDGGAAQETSVNLDGSSLPQVIASLAQQTHTHWQAVYTLAPITGSSTAPSPTADTAHSNLPHAQQLATQYSNGPFTIHFANPPQSTAATSAAPATAAAANAPQHAPDSPASAQGGPATSGHVNAYGYATPPNIAVGNSVVSTPYSVYGDNGD